MSSSVSRFSIIECPFEAVRYNLASSQVQYAKRGFDGDYNEKDEKLCQWLFLLGNPPDTMIRVPFDCVQADDKEFFFDALSRRRLHERRVDMSEEMAKDFELICKEEHTRYKTTFFELQEHFSIDPSDMVALSKVETVDEYGVVGMRNALSKLTFPVLETSLFTHSDNDSNQPDIADLSFDVDGAENSQCGEQARKESNFSSLEETNDNKSFEQLNTLESGCGELLKEHETTLDTDDDCGNEDASPPAIHEAKATRASPVPAGCLVEDNEEAVGSEDDKGDSSANANEETIRLSRGASLEDEEVDLNAMYHDFSLWRKKEYPCAVDAIIFNIGNEKEKKVAYCHRFGLLYIPQSINFKYSRLLLDGPNMIRESSISRLHRPDCLRSAKNMNGGEVRCRGIALIGLTPSMNTSKWIGWNDMLGSLLFEDNCYKNVIQKDSEWHPSLATVMFDARPVQQFGASMVTNIFAASYLTITEREWPSEAFFVDELRFKEEGREMGIFRSSKCPHEVVARQDQCIFHMQDSDYSAIVVPEFSRDGMNYELRALPLLRRRCGKKTVA